MSSMELKKRKKITIQTKPLEQCLLVPQNCSKSKKQWKVCSCRRYLNFKEIALTPLSIFIQTFKCFDKISFIYMFQIKLGLQRYAIEWKTIRILVHSTGSKIGRSFISQRTHCRRHTCEWFKKTTIFFAVRI